MTPGININRVVPPEKNLSQRAVIGGIWVFLLQVVQQLFNLARLMILARILSPQDFGLMGIALLSMTTLEAFSQTGFQQALIQKKNDIHSYLDSAWTFLILRGIILFSILYFIAPYSAIFFDTPDAKLIIQVIGLSVIIQAFTNIGVIHFQKELEFNKQFIYQLSGTLTDFVVAIIAVLLFGNVWALVFGLLAGKAAMLIASYLISPYRPHLSFDIDKIKELFGYGKWILGTSVLVFLVTQGDDILVGKLLSVTALGYYQMAYLISNLPATQITHVISQVTFPTYSKIQTNLPKLREAYLNVLQFTAFISVPISYLIFVLAPDFTLIFLGEKWIPMVSTIKILVFAGLIRSIQATTGPIFYALGKTKIDTKVQTIRFLVIAIFIYPFIIRWGLIGASLTVLISILSACITSILMLIKTIGLSAKEILDAIIYPLICGIISIPILMYLISLIYVEIVEFIGFSLIGILLYVILVIIIGTFFNYNIISNIKKIILSFKNDA